MTTDPQDSSPPRGRETRAAGEPAGAPAPMLEVFVLALAAILLEVGYTRIFSFKLIYYFAYLVIGIALLGLGAGGVFVATSARLRRAGVRSTLLVCSLAAAVVVCAGYLLIAAIPLNLFYLVNNGAGRDF